MAWCQRLLVALALDLMHQDVFGPVELPGHPDVELTFQSCHVKSNWTSLIDSACLINPVNVVNNP